MTAVHDTMNRFAINSNFEQIIARASDNDFLQNTDSGS